MSYKKIRYYKGFVAETEKNEIVVPTEISVNIGVPFWMFNDDAVNYLWVWNEGEVGHWVKCLNRTDQHSQIMAKILAENTHIKIVRLPKEYENNPRFDIAWNTSKDIDLNNLNKGSASLYLEIENYDSYKDLLGL